MDDGLWVLLALAGVIFVLLGPIAFFLTIGARRRLQIAERKILALEAQLRIAQGLPSAAPGTQTGEAPSAQPAQTEEIKPEGEWEVARENDSIAEAENPPSPERQTAPVEAPPPPVQHRVDALHVHPQAPIGIATKKLGETASGGATSQDAVLEVMCLSSEAVAAQTIGDHACVHRPGRAIVVRAGSESNRSRGLGPHTGARQQIVSGQTSGQRGANLHHIIAIQQSTGEQMPGARRNHSGKVGRTVALELQGLSERPTARQPEVGQDASPQVRGPATYPLRRTTCCAGPRTCWRSAAATRRRRCRR